MPEFEDLLYNLVYDSGLDLSYISIVGVSSTFTNPGIISIPAEINDSGTDYHVRNISDNSFNVNHDILGLDMINNPNLFSSEKGRGI